MVSSRYGIALFLNEILQSKNECYRQWSGRNWSCIQICDFHNKDILSILKLYLSGYSSSSSFSFLFFNFFFALTKSFRNLEYKWLKPSLQYVPNLYFTFEIFIMHTKKAIKHISSHNLKQAIAYSSVNLIDYIAFTISLLVLVRLCSPRKVDLELIIVEKPCA